MKVLLLNPPYLQNFIRSSRCTWLPISGSNWYPIFLGYATGWLQKHGHTAKLIDGVVAKYTPEDVYAIAKDFKPDMLVLYVSTQSMRNDIAIGKKIKKLTGCRLIIVGPWCSTHPDEVARLDRDIDGVVRREFEDVVLDLANGKNPKAIKGLTYRDGEKIVTNTERPFLTSAQLNEFPFVTKIYKENLPIANYFQASLLHPYVDLFTARGCVWSQCTFCLWPFTIHKGAVYRVRTMDNVFEELKYIKKELPQVNEVFIQDDMFPTGRARQFSEMLLTHNFKLNWSCYVKADVDYETLKAMKKAGCRYLHVGYETQDPTIIANIHKGTNRETMTKFTRDARCAGLRIHGDFIVGLPGETEQTIHETMRWAKSLGIEGYQVFIPQPHDGTPLYDYLKKRHEMTKKGDINYPHLTRRQLSYWRFKFLRTIYFSPDYIVRTVRNINSLGEFTRLSRDAMTVLPNILFPRKFY